MASVDIPFEGARFHDHWAIYEGDMWTSRDAEGFRISPGVSLIKTPGHTEEDITTLVETDDGLVAFTHMWWTAEGPEDDPFAPDQEVLRASRARLLSMPVTMIIPGHGPAFEPHASRPR